MARRIARSLLDPTSTSRLGYALADSREFKSESGTVSRCFFPYRFVRDYMPPANRIAVANSEIFRRFRNAFDKRMPMLLAGRDVFEACDRNGAEKLVYAWGEAHGRSPLKMRVSQAHPHLNILEVLTCF